MRMEIFVVILIVAHAEDEVALNVLGVQVNVVWEALAMEMFVEMDN